MVVPRTSARPFNCCRQKSSLIITTFGPPSMSSPSVKARPRAGGNPTTEKKFALMRAPATLRAGLLPIAPTVTFVPVAEATPSKISPPNSRHCRKVCSLRLRVLPRRAVIVGGLIETHQAVRICKRQGAQERAFDDRKNRRVSSDPERQRHDRHQTKSGRLDQHPRCVFQVAPHKLSSSRKQVGAIDRNRPLEA